ncbi:MAG: biotin/lipoyl-containing protein, partial [Polaromonas sp.]|nr:biotin/lipoyl-containing protein [Polaromonas sp.]
LVEWQLRVASGEKLPLAQDQLRIHGHAIEARICAENPDNNFLPATGTLHVYGLPPSVSFERGLVRVDAGVREGDAISPYYDSMIAKLIVHGDNREQALARLDEALAQLHIVGLSTNVQFLRHVVQSRSFAQADLDTALIPREEAVLFNQEKLGLPLAAAAAVALSLLEEKAQETADPFSKRDGWRSHGVALRRFEFEFHGEPAKAELTYLHDGALRLAAGDVEEVLVFAGSGGAVDIRFGEQRLNAHIYRRGETVHVFARQGATQITVIDQLAHAGEAHGEAGRLTAPMPGKVVSFAVKAGDKVSKGQALAVMEAMKMEHTIAAPADGVVQEVLYAPGDQVTEGAELLKMVA